jgi:hypothetical protein
VLLVVLFQMEWWSPTAQSWRLLASDIALRWNNEQQAYCYLPSGERFYPSVTEELCGNWDDGRYAWFLEDVKSVDPIYTRGMQGIPRIADPEILQLIEQRLGEVA